MLMRCLTTTKYHLTCEARTRSPPPSPKPPPPLFPSLPYPLPRSHEPHVCFKLGAERPDDKKKMELNKKIEKKTHTHTHTPHGYIFPEHGTRPRQWKRNEDPKASGWRVRQQQQQQQQQQHDHHYTILYYTLAVTSFFRWFHATQSSALSHINWIANHCLQVVAEQSYTPGNDTVQS